MFEWDGRRYDTVSTLVAAGRNDYEISRETGIPRSTVHRWRHHGAPQRQRRLVAPDTWTPEKAPRAYCYLLGLYLGDGNIHGDRSPILRLTMDARYPALINEAISALQMVFLPRSIGHYVRGGGAWVVLQISGRAVLSAFPQHGPGQKHTRRIELAAWQRELTHAHPAELIRGLIHSDGCRTVNRFKTNLPSGRIAEYEYTRYFFSNLSEDIREIFCTHCDLLGVRWTQSNPRNISVSHRASVAILDEAVGPKR